ncbi:MAG: hypothetical protein H7258_03880 [Ferruginibacter sp.]|nr:hypothetical protein [Ferruginibacter sp.]
MFFNPGVAKEFKKEFHSVFKILTGSRSLRSRRNTVEQELVDASIIIKV